MVRVRKQKHMDMVHKRADSYYRSVTEHGLWSHTPLTLLISASL